MRTARIDESQLIADLRKNGQFYIAINLGDIVRRLNEGDDTRLEEFTANRLSEFAEKLVQATDNKTRELGAQLKTFVDTHKPA